MYTYVCRPEEGSYRTYCANMYIAKACTRPIVNKSLTGPELGQYKDNVCTDPQAGPRGRGGQEAPQQGRTALKMAALEEMMAKQNELLERLLEQQTQD